MVTSVNLATAIMLDHKQAFVIVLMLSSAIAFKVNIGGKFDQLAIVMGETAAPHAFPFMV